VEKEVRSGFCWGRLYLTDNFLHNIIYLFSNSFWSDTLIKHTDAQAIGDLKPGCENQFLISQGMETILFERIEQNTYA